MVDSFIILSDLRKPTQNYAKLRKTTPIKVKMKSDIFFKLTLKVSGATAGSISENSATQHALQTETPKGKRFPGAASAGSLLVGNLKH